MMPLNKKWDDFEGYAKEILFADKEVYFFNYIREEAFSSISKAGIFKKGTKLLLAVFNVGQE